MVRGPYGRFWFTKGLHGDYIMCGSDSSGRRRIYAATEDESIQQPRHFAVDGIISFTADPMNLTSELQYPSKGPPKRSLYFTPCPPVEEEPEDFVANPLLGWKMCVFGARDASHPDTPTRSNTAADDIPEKDFWNAYRNDPDRLEHKQREKREREEARDDQNASRKSQKLDPYACCKLSSNMPQLCYRQRSDDWLIHNGNAHYANRRDAFVSLKRIDAYAHVIQHFTDGRVPQTKHIKVAGIGMIKLRVKKQLGHNLTAMLNIPDVLFIPDAACNGLSMEGFEVNGYRLKPNEKHHGHRWTIVPFDSPGIICCGNSSSGRRRLLLPGENDQIMDARHISLGESIDISADTGHLSRIAC